ncbi:hypothetical protein [Nocardia tengchongensis]|uniref:hypothetical protein n=1 Tax=Nocardia tengchongensis TaxID=2055889 RepID=UPI003688205B
MPDRLTTAPPVARLAGQLRVSAHDEESISGSPPRAFQGLMRLRDDIGQREPDANTAWTQYRYVTSSVGVLVDLEDDGGAVV